MPILNFKVDSALLNEIGEKLVETVHIALIELIKNAYDADATKVIVRLKESQNGGPIIHIIDNGIGMTFDEVQRYWMRIATIDKVKNPLSRIYGRPKTGSKGIGRFCCRRLGTNLKLITVAQKLSKNETKETRFERTEVFFPWRQFKAGTEVTQIDCEGTSQQVSNQETGTTLIISDAPTNEWSKRGYDYLRRQLAVLAANRGEKRYKFKEDPGFNIFFDVPRFDDKITDLREELILAGWGTLTAHIDNNFHAVCKLEALGLGKKKITSSIQFPHLKGVTLRIGIIPDKKLYLRNPSILSQENLRKILPEWGGVQVRYKGFRVYPYGDDDWLDIDKDRGLRRGVAKDELFSFAKSLEDVDPGRSLLTMLSMRNHVGNVEIDETAEGFQMKANREGFIKSEAVEELKPFVRFAIDWASIYRDYLIRMESKDKAEIARKDLEKTFDSPIDPSNIVEQTVNFFKDELYSLSVSLPQTDKKKLKNTITKATDAILKHDESTKKELTHLRLIASTSNLLLMFSHEVKSLLGILENNSNLLSALEKKLPDNISSELKEIRKNLQDSKKRFHDLIDMTSLIGFDSSKAKPGKFALCERLKTAEKCFKLVIDHYDIDLQYEDYVAPNIVVNDIFEAELYVIILNILSNSIKSVIAAGGKRNIRISAKRETGRTIISFKDTGVGLSEKYYKDVFIPFLSDPEGKLYSNLAKKLNLEDKYIVGTGSGLGLGIVKEIVESKGGTIQFHKPSDAWNANVEVSLP